MDENFITLEGANPRSSGIAVDASHVYWSDFNAGTIGRANLDGTGVDQSFIPGAGHYPNLVAVDDGHVYWANAEMTGVGMLNGGSIGRANLDGTGVDQSFIPGGFIFGVSEARGPAVDASHIYWSDIGPAPTTIGRANLDGTGIEDSFIEFPLGGDATIPLAVAVDSHHVYWANLGVSSGDGAIGRASIDGTAVERNSSLAWAPPLRWQSTTRTSTGPTAKRPPTPARSDAPTSMARG